MTMKLIKKTDEYSIYQRGDDRYAVKDAAKQPVNGDDKVRILLAEGLITVAEPAAEPEPEPEAAEGSAEEGGGDESPADEAGDEPADDA